MRDELLYGADEAPAARGAPALVHIEANPANALLVRYILESQLQLTVHHAIDGRSAVALCKRLVPDLVISEMHLPDMTAYEVLHALRATATTRLVPLIVLSGDAMADRIERALQCGFDDYWTKPIDVRKFPLQVERALRQYRPGSAPAERDVACSS